MERLTDDEIHFFLEEIPDDINGLTDLESDDDDDPEPKGNLDNNFDKIFYRELTDMSFEKLPKEPDEEPHNREQPEDEDNNFDLTSNHGIEEIEIEFVSDTPSTSTADENQGVGLEEIPSTSTAEKNQGVKEIEIKYASGEPTPSAQKKSQFKNKLKKGGQKKKIPTAKRKVDDRKWKEIEKGTAIPPYNGKDPGPVEGVFTNCKTPTETFIQTIDPVLEKIVYESNLYAVQQGKTLATDRSELLAFIGINFFMGYNVLPSWKDYWSTSADLGCPLVSNTMSRNRFDLLLHNLHVNDNLAKPTNCNDKLYKVRPLIEGLNDQFMKIYNVNKDVAVDESIILFKGRSTLKQYNPMKPIKRGYKLWCLADGKGYISRFDVYQGKFESCPDEELQSFGATEQVVLRLTKPYWNTNIRVYFDNFYSSVPLLEKLKAENVLACGTIRSDRVGLPSFPEKKLSRGDFQSQFSSLGIGVFKWMDNRPVTFISNYHGSGVVVVNRKNKKGEKIEVKCPEVVKDYNTHMGGVDLADQLRQYYCMNRRSKKWWHRIFWGIIDIAFVNSFIIYNSCHPRMRILDYRRAVVKD